MSTRAHPYFDTGMVLNEAEAAAMISKITGNSVEEILDVGLSDYEEAVREKTGAEIAIFYTGRDSDNAESFRLCTVRDQDDAVDYDGYVMLLATGRGISLTKAAYGSEAELEEEFRRKAGKYLPEDFDFLPHIGIVTGVLWY